MPIPSSLLHLLGNSLKIGFQTLYFRQKTGDPIETNYSFAVRYSFPFKLRTYYKHLPTQTETQIDL